MFFSVSFHSPVAPSVFQLQRRVFPTPLLTFQWSNNPYSASGLLCCSVPISLYIWKAGIVRIRLFPKGFDCFFRIIVLRRGNTTLCHLKRYNKLFRDGERHRRDFLFNNDTLQWGKVSLIALENRSRVLLFCSLPSKSDTKIPLRGFIKTFN